MKIYFNLLKSSLCTTLLLVANNIIPVSAQPPSMTIRANINPPTTTEFSANIGNEPEWINCDVYNDPCSSSHKAISVIAWDEYDANNNVWQVKIQVTDHATNTTLPVRTISDARHPDVVFLDCDEFSGAALPGFAIIAVVYEDFSNSEIMFDYWDVGSCMGHGMVPGLSPNHGPWKISGSDPAKYPHIDAFLGDTDPLLKPYYTATPTSNYTPINHFVISWTETVSSVDKIFVDAGHMYYNTGGFPDPQFDNTPTYIGDGEISDVAGVRMMSPLMSNAGRYAHIVYKDASTVYVANYDIDNTTVITNIAQETPAAIIGAPRIDAPNNKTTNNGPVALDFQWKAVAEVIDGNGNNSVHTYDDVNGIVTLESDLYGPIGFTTGLYDMHVPCIAAAQSYQSQNMQLSGSSSACGLNEIQVAMLLDEISGSYYQHTSARLDLVNSAMWGMHDINSTSLNNNINNRLATGIAPNLGITYMSAWNNYSPAIPTGQHTINWKVLDCASTRFEYKPGQPNSIDVVNNNTIIVSPNPATTVINVDGIKNRAVYTITDITGRLVNQGLITYSDNEIKVAQLTHGIYILNLNENGNQQQFKIIKQ